nr:hypothetical protein BaRGS_011048 [Batillaria attramentaria]
MMFNTPPALFAVGDNNSYICDNVPGTTVQSFYMPDQACLLSPEAYKFIIAAVIILMIPLGLAALLYRYRWHIRLALYEMFRGRGDRRHRRLQERDFEYDVFVSFDRDDLNWVLAHLMPELEARLGLRLCIHERDFIPGKNIVDNIADCVEQSKKVMMLFSKSFAESPWCQFELNFCLTHVMEHDDMLVVVMLHEIPPRDLTTAMTAVMATTTYIKWVDQRDARAWFWDRIRITLNEILPRGR